MITRPLLLAVSARADEERRMSTRHPCAGDAVKAIVFLGGEACTTAIQNLSLGGLGVRLNAIVAPGEWLNVELRNSHSGAWLSKQIRAVHVSPARSGQWLLGGQFDPALSTDELRRLLVQPDMASFAGPLAKRS
jgi:PilZ domain